MARGSSFLFFRLEKQRGSSLCATPGRRCSYERPQSSHVPRPSFCLLEFAGWVDHLRGFPSYLADLAFPILLLLIYLCLFDFQVLLILNVLLCVF